MPTLAQRDKKKGSGKKVANFNQNWKTQLENEFETVSEWKWKDIVIHSCIQEAESAPWWVTLLQSVLPSIQNQVAFSHKMPGKAQRSWLLSNPLIVATLWVMWPEGRRWELKNEGGGRLGGFLFLSTCWGLIQCEFPYVGLFCHTPFLKKIVLLTKKPFQLPVGLEGRN